MNQNSVSPAPTTPPTTPKKTRKPLLAKQGEPTGMQDAQHGFLRNTTPCGFGNDHGVSQVLGQMNRTPIAPLDENAFTQQPCRVGGFPYVVDLLAQG